MIISASLWAQNPSIELVGQYTAKAASDLKVRGDFAYVTDLNAKQLYILNIADPTTLTLVGSYTSPHSEATMVSLIDQYAYVTVGWSGFEIIDISDPAHPTKVGATHDTPGYTKDIEFANGHAFVAARESGVRVYNVSNPSNPSYVTTYSTSAWATSMVVSGNYLYVGIEHSPNGIDVFNISNPPTQNKAGSLSGTNSVMGIAKEGSYVYHSGQWENTFNVIDVADPSAPVRLGSGFPTHGDPWGIAVSGNLAFLGERSYGLQVLDVSNPANPALLDEYNTGGDPHWGIAVTGDYVYLADGPGGVKIFSMSGSPQPDGWQFAFGNWVVDGDVLCQTDYSSSPTGSQTFAWQPRAGSDFDTTISFIINAINPDINHALGYDVRVGIIANTEGAIAGNDRKWSCFLTDRGYLALLEENIAHRAKFPYTPQENVPYNMRMQVVGNTVYGKVWQDGETEPDWMVTDNFQGPYNKFGVGVYAEGAEVCFNPYESAPLSCLSITNYEIIRGINGLTSWLPQYSVHKVGCINEAVKLVVTYSNSCGVPAAAALNVELTTPAGDVYDYILGFLATESAGEAELVLESGAFEFVGKYKLIVSVDEPLWEEEFYLIYETPTDLGDYCVSQTLCYTEDVNFDYDKILEATLNGSFIWNAETITLPDHLTPTNDISDAVRRLKSLSHMLITYCEYDHLCPEVEPPRRWHPRVEEILRKKTGVCQDYSYCFVSMCRVIGIPARTIFADRRPPKTYDPESGRDNSHCGCNPYTPNWPHVWAEAFVGEDGDWLNLDAGWIHVEPTDNKIDNPCIYIRGEYHSGINGDNHCAIIATLPDGCGVVRDEFYETSCEMNGQYFVNSDANYVSESPCAIVDPQSPCDWLCQLNRILDGIGKYIWSVRTGSPVDVHVYDAFGNHLGFDEDGEIEYGIYNALLYQLEDNHQFAFGDSIGETYHAIIKGSKLGKYQLAVLMPNDGLSTLLMYNDVPTSSTARDSVFISEYSENHSLFLDTDGDGLFDEVRYPNTVIIGTGVGETGSIAGLVRESNQGLLGVPVDLYDSSGDQIGTTFTDSIGEYHFDGLISNLYTVSIATPLGFMAENETKTTNLFQGFESKVNFNLTELDITPRQRSRGYWAHQLHRALKNRPRHYTRDDFANFAGLINKHFNQNQANPVDFYSVPQPASQQDSLKILKRLLHMRKTGENDPFLKRLAKAQLIALMLSVVSGKIHQTHEISADGRTISQAITYCDMLVNDEIDPPEDGGPGHGSPWCRYIRASFILVKANLGLTVPARMIPEDVIEIAYRLHNEEILPEDFVLDQNHPNPFNPITEINFVLPAASNVSLDIYNIMGQKVATMADGFLEAGEHSVTWDGSDVASGVYFYRLKAGEFIETRKMILLK